ncbi:unnamed protein product, partial [Ilex paraguariensis]
MNTRSFLSLLFLSLFNTNISAHFFPNISSIPPSFIPNTTAGDWASFNKLLGCHTGQKVDGVAKLKRYFQYFGYLNSSTNCTDDFDDVFESALRTYQLNFNLNATGELDGPTLKKLVSPRCGNADIINGTSSMNSGKGPSATPIHLSTVSHYTFFPGTPRWPASRTELSYGFSPDNQISDTVKNVFSGAFERWSEVTPLTFTETTSFYTADIKIGFFAGDHGDGEPFDGVLGTLAHAFSPPSGRLHLDDDENWVVDGNFIDAPSGTSAVDLESVAVHEIGHLLGLGHSSVEEAIMYPTISSGSRKTELANDDIEGIQVLYGANPNYNGTSTLTPAQRDTNGAHFLGPFWDL